MAELKYTPQQGREVKNRIMDHKVTALNNWYSTSGIKVNEALETIRGRVPKNKHRYLEARVKRARQFFESIGSNRAREEAPFNLVCYWYSRFINVVDFLRSQGIDVSWKNSAMSWALTNKDRTDEEIFNSEMASRLFYDACNERGYYGGPEIEEALRRGEIPVEVVENVLIYDAGLGGKGYPAIREGYQEKLSIEAQKKLQTPLAS